MKFDRGNTREWLFYVKSDENRVVLEMTIYKKTLLQANLDLKMVKKGQKWPK